MFSFFVLALSARLPLENAARKTSKETVRTTAAAAAFDAQIMRQNDGQRNLLLVIIMV